MFTLNAAAAGPRAAGSLHVSLSLASSAPLVELPGPSEASMHASMGRVRPTA